MAAKAYPGPQRPMLAAQLRMASEACHELVFARLRSSGFGDLRQSHYDLFRFPGPEGRTPTEIASHVGLSKQALNPLLNELEAMGYVKRERNPKDARSRTVTLSRRGLRLVTAIKKALEELEQAAEAAIGPEAYRVMLDAAARVRDVARARL
ncbi:MAG: MarR family winged helix-turn-helix transcriptional regulator [Acidimicrobiales bacterium]